MTIARKYSDQPRAGFYKMRLTRDGPFVAASIGPRCPMMPADYDLCDVEEWCRPLDRSWPHLVGWIDGMGFEDPWKFYSWCQPIAEVDFRFMIAHAEWARTTDPELPTANPQQPIDLFTSKPAF